MRRAPPPPSDAEFPIASSSPPPPLSDEPHKNPWRISPSGGGAAGGSVSLMGEPSSWPPLIPQHRSDSPPPETHPSTVIEKPSTTDLPSSSSSLSSSSSSSAEIASHEDTVPPSTEPPAMKTIPSSAPPPPVAAIMLPPSPGNAAAAESPRPLPRPPASPQRRGRNPRGQHHRGGGGPRYNNGYNNRSSAPGWRPNWNFDSPPQFPNWGFYPGSAVGAIPPADVNHFFVAYPQPYNGMFYSDYGTEPYGAYYDHPAYELPFTPPLSPMIASPPPSQVAPSFSGVSTRDHQVDVVKDHLLFQIEYYFSDENLVKDAYLKRQMDSEGWVDIHVIAGFRKVACLTEDINLIKDALQSSNVVELQGNKMRKRHEWDKWILQRS